MGEDTVGLRVGPRVHRGPAAEAAAPLTPFERCLSEYDAIQLLPIEPTIERERGPWPWSPAPADEPADPDAEFEVEVRLRRPDVIDWGYDVAFAGMAATNPALLEGGRPDEAIELAEALHGFPGRPIMLILDLVYGHADDQSLAPSTRRSSAGPTCTAKTSTSSTRGCVRSCSRCSAGG